MKKHLLTLCVALLVLSVCALGLCACFEKECEHSYVPSVTAPTCTERGYTTYTCKLCGEHYVDDYVDARHNYGTWIAEVAASCSAAGTKGHYHCDGCDKNFDADKNEIADIEISVANHNFGEWINEEESTCKTTGTKGHYHCDGCNKNFDEDYVEISDLTLPVTDHDYGTWIDEESANCLQTGTLGHYHCSMCEKNFDTDKKELSDLQIPIADHDYSTWIEAKSATCSETGMIGHYTCEYCGKNFDAEKNELLTDVVIATTDHDYGTWIDEVSANCTTAGTKGHYHCKDCNQNFDSDKDVIEDIEIKPHHTFGSWNDGKPETCTEPGTVGYYHCSACGKNFDDKKLEVTDLNIPARGHNYGTWIEETPATCKTTGTLGHYHCNRCSVDFDEQKNQLDSLEIAMSDHDYGTWIDKVDSKCVETGTLGHYHCSVCEKNFDTNHVEIEDLTIEAKGHNWENGVCTMCKELKFSTGLKFELSSNKSYYSLAGLGTCTDTEIVIPDTYEGLPVTQINGSVFANSNVTSIVVPKSVTSFSNNAFRACNSLEKLTIPLVYGGSNYHFLGGMFGATKYQDNANYVPATLKEVVVTKDSNIREYAFYGCDMIEVLVFENENLALSMHALTGLKGLKSLTYSEPSNGHNELGYYFTTQSSWSNSYVPDTLQEVTLLNADWLADGAFKNCSSLKKITLPNNLTKISYAAFSGCSSLETINIPNTVTNIWNSAFSECTSLKSITIPASVTSISTGAFCDCTNLESVVFEENSQLTVIGQQAFYSCSSLTSITIPASVTTLSDQAFYFCTSLTNVTFEEGSNLTSIGTAFYQTALKSFDIPEGFTTIEAYTFNDFKNFTVVIPTSVTLIESNAFNRSGIENNTITVLYAGTAEEWENVNMYGLSFSSSSIYYYSEEAVTEGRYWHYVDGVPTIWEVAE